MWSKWTGLHVRDGYTVASFQTTTIVPNVGMYFVLSSKESTVADSTTESEKKKAVHKTNTTDDKRLQGTLKRIGVNAIPAIEEVNIFKEDVVIQFINPKVQASIAANTWVVSGTPQTKRADNLENLKKLAEQFQKQQPGAAADATLASVPEDDDEVPELVAGETFEAAAEEGLKAS